MSRATVRCETSIPSLSNSPWMRGAPQSGFASAMVRTRFTSSEPTGGRPVRPRRDFQVQKARKPCRCQRITVSGRTSWSASRHPAHWFASHTQRRRSRRLNCGCFDRRRSRASRCRSARFSSVRSVRVLSAARRAPNTASTRDIALHGSHAARPSSSLGIKFWQTTGIGRSISEACEARGAQGSEYDGHCAPASLCGNPSSSATIKFLANDRSRTRSRPTCASGATCPTWSLSGAIYLLVKVDDFEFRLVVGLWALHVFVGAPQESVDHLIRILVDTRDCSLRVDAEGCGTRSTRDVKAGDRSVSGSHEPVAHAPRIVVEARNCPHWIVGVRVSTLVKPRTSAWSVEGGDHAVSGSHESVWRASAEFMVEPRDLTLRVDARGFGVKRLARRVRDAKAGDRAIWCSQEPMPMVIIPADVVPRD